MIRLVTGAFGLVLCAMFLFPSCGGDESGASENLQSSCVHDFIDLPRNLADGEECANFGYADCEPIEMASECQGYCAFDVCQASSCASDSECVSERGAGFECLEYVVSGDSYGDWCGESDCPKGTFGCPCKDGACTPPDDYWVMTCSANDVCDGDDSCPSGCRAGSVCCGAGLCSGDCIGTPCC